METLRLAVDRENMSTPVSEHALNVAAAFLRNGGTVALPTETVYGLGANAFDVAAVAKIFDAKGRPGWDPLIVHISDEAMLERVVASAPIEARKLMAAFWPGPMTLLLPRSVKVPDAVTAGRPLVGVRMPRHAVALELIRRAAVPIAAPSANRFGHTSPTTAQHVLEDLEGLIDAVVDAGPTEFGVESTVIDPNQSPMVIYRPGAVTIEQVREVAGPAEFFVDSARAVELDGTRGGLPSPGVGLRHYAPRARLILVDCGDDEASVQSRLREELLRYEEEGVGILWPGKMPDLVLTGSRWVGLYPWGDWQNPDELAQRLFAGLRCLDLEGYPVILCPIPPENGIGVAIRHRLRKAAYND